MKIKLIPKVVPVKLQKIDPDATKQLDNIYLMLKSLIETKNNENVSFLNGQILKEITVTNTAKIFSHSLGRQWSGYFVTKRENSNIPYNTETLMHDKSNAIELISSASVVIDLYIF